MAIINPEDSEVQRNRGIFLENEETGAICDTVTINSDASSFLGRAFYENSDSTTEKTLFMSIADDDAQTPNIAVDISLAFGDGWGDWQEIATETAPCDITVSSYDQSWWRKNNGTKFRVRKGSGTTTITNANWI